MDYYLKAGLKAEPLICKWYAWPHLVVPTTFALYTVGRHLQIMESFVRNPKVHCTASADPALLGGSFMNIDPNNLVLINELLYSTKKYCADAIQLADDIKNFNEYLQQQANGKSLEPFYEQIPDSLKGCIELVYDLNNHPSIRLIEPILYKKYYKKNYQSIVLSPINDHYRPFVLSTPRINCDNGMELNIPFDEPILDELFSMRYIPKKKHEIINLLKLSDQQLENFDSIFEKNKIPNLQNCDYTGKGIRVRYYGHACILLETNNLSILFDPIISYNYSSNIERYTFDDLPRKIDYVVYTHAHDDHVMLESILQLRFKLKTIVVPKNNVGFLADPSLKLMFEHLGFKNVIELKEFESKELPNGKIIALPFLGEHGDLNIQSKLGYLVELQGHKFLFLADSNNLEPKLYEYIFDMFGAIDVMYIGLECVGAPLTWLYGPLLMNSVENKKDKSRRFSGSDCQKAAKILKSSGAKEAYIYAMGQEPWLSYFMAISYNDNSPQIIESKKFMDYCALHNIKSELLYAKREWHYGLN